MMFDSLFRFLSRGRASARPKPRPRVVPTLEALEERWVPSATDGTMSLQTLLGGTSIVSAPQTTDANPPMNVTGAQTQTVAAAFAPFKTGGSESQSVAQFDPSKGTLTGIQILVNGKLTSDVQVENLDGAPSNVTAQVNGNLTLQGPGFTPLSVTPSINESATLSPFDGILDYGGTSGKDFGAQSAQASRSINLSAASNDLSAWIGKGNVSLTELAQSTSTVSGSGNEQVHINSQGSGSVQVVYSYTPAATPSTPPPVSPPSGCDNPPSTTPSTPPPVSPPTVSPPTTCTPPSGPASLGGIVYVDARNLNHYVQGDPGVPGVTVNLNGTTVTGQAVSLTTTTGSNGIYNFTNLQPGIYSLSDQQPAQYTRGAETLGSLGGAVIGDHMVVAIPQGADGMCYDFGEDPPLPPPAPPPAPPGNPPPNVNPVPTSPPVVTPPSDPSSNGNPTPPSDPSLPFFPAVDLSKRSLLGDGWQSLG